MIRDRALLTWVAESSKAFSNSFQFACYESASREEKLKVGKLSPEEISKRGQAWFSQNIDLFGITEHFEESIMWFALHLGLPSVPVWTTDKRNVNRPKWKTIDQGDLDSIAEFVQYDVEFYQEKEKEFLACTRDWRGDSLIARYIEACDQPRLEQAGYGA